MSRRAHEVRELPQISESARKALIEASNILREGFTGTIELECSHGGVKRMHTNETWRPGEYGEDSP
jgi:hypothetical protein